MNKDDKEKDKEVVSLEPTQPKRPTVERKGRQVVVPMVGKYPSVIGGVCEHCGTMDSNRPPEEQYKLCPHFYGMELACSYCPDTSDPVEVVKHNKLAIHTHPDDPSKLVVCCDNPTCADAHRSRFMIKKNG